MTKSEIISVPQIMPHEIIIDDNFTLRLLEAADAEKIKEILDADPTIQNRVTWTHQIKNTQDIIQKIESMSGDSSRYAIRFGDSVKGYIGLWEDDEGYMDGIPKKGEYGFGYFLDPSARGSGIVNRAARAIMDTAQNNFTVDRFAIYIEDDNSASQAVAEKLGFQRTEKVFTEPVMNTPERRWEKVISQ